MKLRLKREHESSIVPLGKEFVLLVIAIKRRGRLRICESSKSLRCTLDFAILFRAIQYHLCALCCCELLQFGKVRKLTTKTHPPNTHIPKIFVYDQGAYHVLSSVNLGKFFRG